MASNYQDVLAQMQSAGLAVTDLQIGRMVRCRVEGDREKRGWYVLHELTTNSGDLVIIGSFGVWQGASSNSQKIEIHKDAFTAEQRAALRTRMAEDRRRADAVRKAAAKRAAEQAAKVWGKCSPTGESDYLERKGIAAHGVRFSPGGALIVPMLDGGGTVQGLQVIRSTAAAKAAKRPGKEFWPAGVAMRGTFHLIGLPVGLVLLTEGYATGASLHEATGLPVAIGWAANNLAHVAAVLKARYPRARILICADDDAFAKCQHCETRILLADAPKECPQCGKEHGRSNAGVGCASTAAVQVGGAYVKPAFENADARDAAYLSRGLKLTDFNDLHQREGLHVVRNQVETRLTELKWSAAQNLARSPNNGGVGNALRAIESTEEMLERYALIYALGGSLFDRQEHQVVSLSDVRDACRHREVHKQWMQHPDRSIVRATEVDFDPGCEDPQITCNLWAGWPTAPLSGACDKLLDLLRHMCSGDDDPARLYDWVIRWLAFPIQNPGAKMQTTLVLHGPQGTGKNMFFEAVMAIYGEYGRIIDQSAIEDKFNDWASRKLFLIADEVVARTDLFHVKNKLKAFITGSWIRINPKNMAARDERNHVNMVFLSNEPMPVALEEDDRRHAVIWTPAGLSEAFYQAVANELAAGGAAALHHHLLQVDLTGFKESTRPPFTDAKEELINLGRDSTSRFFYEFCDGEIGTFREAPMLALDLYDLYKAWCHRTGTRAAPMAKLVNVLHRKHHVRSVSKRYRDVQSVMGPHRVLMFGSAEPQPGQPEQDWLGETIQAFRDALKDYRGSAAL